MASWFDFKNLNAKLERLKNDNGLYLKITFDNPVDPLKILASVEKGWVPNIDYKGKVFTNINKFSKLSEVKDFLTCFFDEDQIFQRKVPIKNLQQGEQVVGYMNGVASQNDTIKNNISMLSIEKQQDILNKVENAQRLLSLSKKQEKKIFDNNARNLLDDLSRTFGGATAAALMVGAFKAINNGDNIKKIEDKLYDAVAQEKLPNDLCHELTRKTLIKQSQILDVDLKFDYGDKYELMLGRSIIPRLNINYNIWDGVSFGHINSVGKNENIKFDLSVKFSDRSNLSDRIELYYRNIGKILNVDADTFKNNLNIHVGVNPLQNSVGAYHSLSSLMDDNLKAGLMKIYTNHSSVFNHEFGHYIDTNFLTDDLRKEILDKSLVEQQSLEIINKMRALDYISDEYATYLKAPSEIFARAFDASISNKAYQEEDFGFLQAGGSFLIGGGVYYSPTPDLTDNFISILSDYLNKYSLEINKSINEYNTPSM